MADYEKSSQDGSLPAKQGNNVYVLDERRRAALAEIDNAEFS